ncbi:MAG: NADH-quinone oxidoreductase subunit A [Candidatus Sumerlaeia bacterium]|nr:NADH-quinone oxidoreductase subunit A [Candidatus Sumerlaeia bacterium]
MGSTEPLSYGFANILLFLAAAVGFVIFNLTLGSFFRRDRFDPEKMRVYECGEPAIGTSWIRYSIAFYRLALVFLVFDVEVVFLFPVVVVLKRLGWLAFGEIMVFVVVLVVALIYAWRFGCLEWITAGMEETSTRPQSGGTLADRARS